MATKTPQDVLKRVRRLSALNGWSVAVFSGLCTLISLFTGGLMGASVGAVVTLGGIVELHGRKMLGRRNPDGMRWLVKAQLIVLSSIWIYAISQLASFDASLALANLTPDIEQILNEAGLASSDILPLIQIMFYTIHISVLLVTLIYQGGLAIYYRSRTPMVTTALKEAPIVPPSLNG